ncbi:hypothetical protein LR48_Vigan04g225600 [Vigna angularis]|uniref:Uncharacterized protein n=1 Tax=Phaseolus angularis TaxID=3914 RepID=A0A0L9UH33_PHAAN|nr:hypothetical protein LR48_Vigan04g225600 [Vigna angularis]
MRDTGVYESFYPYRKLFPQRKSAPLRVRAIDVMVEPQENVNPIQELTLKQENGSGGSSSEQIGDKKKGGRTKANPETDLAKSTATDLDRVVEKDPREVSSPSQQENPDVNISPKSVMNNGVACALTNSKSIKKQEDAECSNHSEGLNISGHVVRNDLDSEKVDNSNDKETEKKLKNNSKKVSSSPHEDHLVEAAGPSENDKEVDAKTLSPTVYNNESEVASPLSKNLHGENRSKKLGRTKTKDGPVKDVAGEDVSKVSGGGAIKKGSGEATDADAKKHSAKKLDENKKGSGGSSSKQIGDKKKGGKTKANPETDLAKSTATDVDRESDVKDYGENLEDCEYVICYRFYKGVIHFSYSGKKKRKVLYDDGDEETLNLGKEKWKLIEVQMKLEGQSERKSLDASTDIAGESTKQGKTSAGESTKQGKVDGSSKSSGAAASSRSKGASVKSSQKSKDGNKSKDSKTISKSEDRVSRKSKDDTPKSGSSKIVAAAVKKMSNKSKSSDTSKANESKDDDTSKPKSAAKSKQETPKGGKSKQETLKSAISKGKPRKGGGKRDVN